MIRSTDVGSLPFPEDPISEEGLTSENFFGLVDSYNAMRYFYPNQDTLLTRAVLKGTGDKRVDVRGYAQYGNMIEMFLRNIEGLEKVDKNYYWKKPLSIKKEKAMIAEVSVLRDNLRGLAEKAGGKVDLRVPLTGPDTLAPQVNGRTNDIYTELGEVLSKVAKENVFNEKHGKVVMVSIDEPSFGVDNSNLDSASERERLLKAWNGIVYEAKQAGAETTIHLHNTSNPLYWQSDVKIIGSHVGDSIYTNLGTKRLLEEYDKFLVAPIAVAQFEDLIRQRIPSDDLGNLTTGGKIAVEWEKIRTGKADPASYLEGSNVIEKRLEKIVEVFGEERVPYAGPDCGFGGHHVGKRPLPEFYDCAIEQLRLTAFVVEKYNASAKAK